MSSSSPKTGTHNKAASQQLRQRKARLKLADVVKQVTMMSTTERDLLQRESSDSRASGLVPYIEGQRSNSSRFFGGRSREEKSNTASLLENAEHMENMLLSERSLLQAERETSPRQTASKNVREFLPADEERPQETSPLLQPTTPTTAPTRQRPQWWQTLLHILQPQEMLKSIRAFVLTWVLCFMVPCLVAAAFVYYGKGYLDTQWKKYLHKSLPGLSWCLLFFVRLAVTFNLARLSEWVLHLLTMKTGLLARFAGPLLALIAMQSQGWPFLLSAWGVWNFLLLHGTSLFVQHWLFFTNIELFSVKYNVGNGFLASLVYGRMLLAVMVVGLAVSIKRTFVALFFSSRMLQFYRPQLEYVMAQVKIVMEVAELAAETEREGFDQRLANAKEAAQQRLQRHSKAVPTFEGATKDTKTAESEASTKEKVKQEEEETDMFMAELEEEAAEKDNKLHWEALKQRAMNDRHTITFDDREHQSSTATSIGSCSTTTDPDQKNNRKGSSLVRSSSRGLNAIYPFLERWQEPEDKGSKKADPTLHDILQFKKAVAFLNDGDFNLIAKETTPNRRALVKNAVKLYRRLLQFTPDEAVLSFDVIGALAYDSQGNLNEERAVALLRVFLPDNDGMVPMLAFVQAIDHVYKKMRFLRASLSNASKIDTVLENIFNVVFYVVLGLFVLSALGFNPWPLLLSFSTFAISFAFAFGSSVAKGLEGVLLIAVRRPYDIGDRISICGAECVANPSSGDTWLVEDISLTTTTLRYAATNEVATINNASIANARIVNGSRSPKASVTFRIIFDITKATPQKIEEFRMRIESYLEDRPRIWVSPLIQYRTEQVDSDNGFIVWMYRAQHVKSWQELGPILLHKGELERFADTTATEMGIVMITPFRHMTVGLGVAPENKGMAAEDRERMKDILRSICAKED